MFKLSIPTIINLLMRLLAQLQECASEKLAEADGKQEQARVLDAEAAALRLEAKTATALANNIGKLME